MSVVRVSSAAVTKREAKKKKTHLCAAFLHIPHVICKRILKARNTTRRNICKKCVK